MRSKTAQSIAILFAGSIGNAFAAVTYFNVGSSTTGNTVVTTGTYAGTWHNVQAGAASSGSHTSAVVSADGFDVSTTGGYNSADTNGNNYGGTADLNAVSTALLWGASSNSGDVPTITISGLDANTEYSLSIFTGINNNVEYQIGASANGTGGTSFSSSAILSSTEWTAGTPVTTTIMTGAGGDTITITANDPPAAGDTATFNNGVIWGFGIEAIPEPSSAALLGLAGTVLLVRRRR